MKYLLAALCAGSASAALPPGAKFCDVNYPNRPDHEYLTISEQIEAADYVFYAKAINKLNVTTSLMGQRYTVEWSQECYAIKQPAKYLIPQTFLMPDMGAADLYDLPCGPRDVVTGFNYLFFATNSPEEVFGVYHLQEVNNQTGIYRLDHNNKAELAPYLYDCLSGDQCHPDNDDASETWEPMLLADRIKASEYAIEIHMKDESHGCVQCVIRQPAMNLQDGVSKVQIGYGLPNPFEPQLTVNETVVINSHSICQDYNLEAGKRYIMLLEKVSAIGEFDPDTYFPDEVNGQQAIYELTSEIQAELNQELLREIFGSSPRRIRTFSAECSD